MLKMWRAFEPKVGFYVPDLALVATLPHPMVNETVADLGMAVVLIETEDTEGGCNHSLGIV